MICTNCNNEIDNDSNFCKYCGTKVVKANVCPKCGAEHLPKDAKFCPDCGAPLVMKDEAAIRQGAARIVEKYPKGYKRFVLRRLLPHFSSRIGIASCEKIISMESDIADAENTISIEESEYKKKIERKTNAQNTEYVSPSNFVKSHVQPYWPQHGKEMEQSKVDALKHAINIISKTKRENLSELYLSKYQFIEQCIKAILDISQGCAPNYRGLLQQSSNYWSFWQETKRECGEGNYNKYWHYNSGVFADRVLEQLKKL